MSKRQSKYLAKARSSIVITLPVSNFGKSSTVSSSSRRMAVFDDVDPQAKLRLYDSSVSPLNHNSPESFAEWQVDIRHGDVTIPRLQWVEPLRAEMQHFLDCVRQGVPCRTGAADGTAVTAAIVAAQESLRRGGTEVLLEEILGA